jgi:hypothetical protein
MVWGGRGKEPMSEVKSKGCPLCSFTPCKREGCAFFVPSTSKYPSSGCAIFLLGQNARSINENMLELKTNYNAVNKIK